MNLKSHNICRVFIRNLEIPAQIGIHSHEQGRMQPIRINIDVTAVDAENAEDDIEHAIDYASIETMVRRLVSDGHIRLAETLARRIANSCLADDRVIGVRVRIEKLDALNGAESAGAEVQKFRSSSISR